MKFKVDRKAAVKKIKTLVLTPKTSIEQFRAKIEKKFNTELLPNNVERQEKNYNGVKCDVLTPEIHASGRLIVYVHGGSFVGGGCESWRGFCSSIANACSSRVIVPDFRLPPSYPYPAAQEDVENVLFALSAEEKFKKLNTDEKDSPTEFIIAADGSGASIALGLLFRVNSKLLSQIKKVILLSPWLDLSTDCELLSNKKLKDEVISSEDIRYAADLYTYSSNLVNKQISPLKAEKNDLINFPEFYIQNGEKEILLSQAQRFKNLAEEAGIKCTLDTVPDMMYMFQTADEHLEESSAAIDRIGAYLNINSEFSEEELLEREKLIKENNISVE